MIKIGKMFNIEKGTLQSSKCTPGQYDFVTASEDWKTHITYSHDCEALVFAMAASGSLGRTHYVNGKFISSDLCFILTPKDEYINKINLKFYYYYFNTFRENIVKDTATGTSKLAINRKIFSNYYIHYIDIDKQNKLIPIIENTQQLTNELKNNIVEQKECVGKLRQSILQQAVEGKLCEQNPDDDPASVLLEKIKKEKDKLVKEGKIKKSKELSPVSDEEKSFELPQGWEWCRLEDIYIVNPKNELNENLEVSFVPMNLIGDGFNNKHSSEKRMWFDVKKGYTHFQENDIGIAKITPCFENRKSVIFKNLYNYIGAGTTELFVLRSIRDINNSYILFCLKTDRFINEGISTYTGTAGQQRVSKSFIEKFLVPIPPLQEQQRIVEKVNKLMLLCDDLEKEVDAAQQYASQLMEAVLQEAFSTDKPIAEEQSKQKCKVIPIQPKQETELHFAMAARGSIKQSTLESLQKRAIEIANGEK